MSVPDIVHKEQKINNVEEIHVTANEDISALLSGDIQQNNACEKQDNEDYITKENTYETLHDNVKNNNKIISEESNLSQINTVCTEKSNQEYLFDTSGEKENQQAKSIWLDMLW